MDERVGGKHLIIVEDELLIAEMVRTMVEELGWTVDGVAHSAAEGHSILNENEPAVAILDINLGNSTSAGVAAVCHQRGIHILYITGYSADRVSPGPSLGVLVKPFTAEELAAALGTAERHAQDRRQGRAAGPD